MLSTFHIVIECVLLSVLYGTASIVLHSTLSFYEKVSFTISNSYLS